MAKCANCGKKGFLLTVNSDSLCEECARPKDFTDTVTGALQGFWEIPFGTESYTASKMLRAKIEELNGSQIAYFGNDDVLGPDWYRYSCLPSVSFAGYRASLKIYIMNDKFYKGTVTLGETKGAYGYKDSFEVSLFFDLYKKYSNPLGDKKAPFSKYINSYTWKFENDAHIKFFRDNNFFDAKGYTWRTEYVDDRMAGLEEEKKRALSAEWEAKKAKEAERLTTEL
ncbi:MAG: hypothetical protein LBD48_06695 [Treponema sp.]|jgi:hypothetical protein|nr:hypothetical protein [Treponema sp.]